MNLEPSKLFPSRETALLGLFLLGTCWLLFSLLAYIVRRRKGLKPLPEHLQDMVILYIPLPSQQRLAQSFDVALVEGYLQLAKIPYVKQQHQPPLRPQPPNWSTSGSLYIRYNDLIVQHPFHIIQWIKERFTDLDQDLTAEQRSIANAFQSLIVDRLYFVMLWFRWLDPAGFRNTFQIFVAPHIPWYSRWQYRNRFRQSVQLQLVKQGLGRLHRDDVLKLGCSALDDLSCFLGMKSNFVGIKRPTTIDAYLFAILVNLLYSHSEFGVDGNPLVDYASKKQNLVIYTNRILKLYFPECCDVLENCDNRQSVGSNRSGRQTPSVDNRKSD